MTLSNLIISINLLPATSLFFAKRRLRLRYFTTTLFLSGGFGQILMPLLIYPDPQEQHSPIFYLVQHAREQPAFIAVQESPPFPNIFLRESNTLHKNQILI